ncbi:hypothetical protein KIN20_020608 [Parelaphostrongylus tenuis]|uniref:Armadillo repeat-containing domain-containing protein n=1 Tax=Parelaphostrongylus tenuis TaxID=148309 RepID=A0AAD5QTP0_PARTN|nr:hypothetical protein KIN20_020608 [Parelaphostrongylus tenuis]
MCNDLKAIPQKDPDEETEPSWRITVNPSAELFGSPRLRQVIDRLYHQQKLLSPTDAKQVLSALQTIDPSSDLLLPLLTVISNATAYPANQALMREMRITERVVEMIFMTQNGWSRSCRIMLLQCLANMAVCTENYTIVRRAIPYAVLCLSQNDETQVVVALQALTNLSLTISQEERFTELPSMERTTFVQWRPQISKFTPAIPHCLSRLWTRGEPNINALRLLVNLSCCPDMVPHVLAAKSVTGLLRLLDTDREEVLLRVVTWLLCTSSAVDALNLTYDRIACHIQDPNRSPVDTLYHSIYGPQARNELEQRTQELSVPQ